MRTTNHKISFSEARRIGYESSGQAEMIDQPDGFYSGRRKSNGIFFGTSQVVFVAAGLTLRPSAHEGHFLF
ncbi:hypothetical protein, partial [Novipirellula sp.]|uniref:hypothetical protein n=1 Tax=Novipirellula sp. TaxID=2795430 RepID=UPI0035657FC5